MIMTKILIIEDSMYTAKAVKLVLESSKFEVEHINDSTKAMKTLLEKKIDAVILDLMMPNISGVDILKQMKKTDGLKELPILILTARIDLIQYDDSIKRLLSSKDKLMRKPFDNNDLITTIKSMINQ